MDCIPGGSYQSRKMQEVNCRPVVAQLTGVLVTFISTSHHLKLVYALKYTGICTFKILLKLLPGYKISLKKFRYFFTSFLLYFRNAYDYKVFAGFPGICCLVEQLQIVQYEETLCYVFLKYIAFQFPCTLPFFFFCILRMHKKSFGLYTLCLSVIAQQIFMITFFSLF